MIRPAVHADIPEILPLLERLHDRTIYSDVPFCERSAAKSLADGIDSMTAIVLIDGTFQGVLALNASVHPANYRYLIAKEVVFAGERHGVGRELYEAGLSWARELGCKEVQMGLEPAVCGKAMYRLYRLWGLTPAVVAFARRL